MHIQNAPAVKLQFSNRIGTYHGGASIPLNINTCSSIDRTEGLAAVPCILSFELL